MERDTEIALLRQCLKMAQGDKFHLQGREHFSPVSRYTDPQRYQREQERIFRRQLVPYLHVSQLDTEDCFVTLDTPLGSVLVTRDASGKAQAFHNVCRHRGTQLVASSHGKATQFRCPYHAWTYSNRGELVAVPHGKTCFPSLRTDENGLAKLTTREQQGFIWIGPASSESEQSNAPADTLAEHLDWLDLPKLEVFAQDSRTWQANWKLIAEGGLETYHFRFAHRDTIAAFFLDNCAVSDSLGDHTRTILPFANVLELADKDPAEWSIRDHAHILYSVFPMSSFLVERDHVVWIHAQPLAVDQTAITVSTLVPGANAAAQRKDPKLLGKESRSHCAHPERGLYYRCQYPARYRIGKPGCFTLRHQRRTPAASKRGH